MKYFELKSDFAYARYWRDSIRFKGLTEKEIERGKIFRSPQAATCEIRRKTMLLIGKKIHGGGGDDISNYLKPATRKETHLQVENKNWSNVQGFFPLRSNELMKGRHTQLQKEREQKAGLSERGKWSGAICVDKAKNWLQEVTRSTYRTPDK